MRQTRLPFEPIRPRPSRGLTKVDSATGVLRTNRHSRGVRSLIRILHYLNRGLWIFLPAGFVVNYIHLSGVSHPSQVIIFAVNFVAIFPTSSVISHALEELISLIGNKWGILIYMSFGNIVQIITSILLILNDQVLVFQNTLIGTLNVLTLLNFSAAISIAAFKRRNHTINYSFSHTSVGLLQVAAAMMIIPTAFDMWNTGSSVPIAAISRGTSMVILLGYVAALIYQYYSHSEYFHISTGTDLEGGVVLQRNLPRLIIVLSVIAASPSRVSIPTTSPTVLNEQSSLPYHRKNRRTACILTLVFGTTIILFNTQFMTDSIDGLTQARLPTAFVGLVLLPLLSNDSVSFEKAWNGQLDAAIEATLGKALQLALVVDPIIILVGWMIGNDGVTLSFDGFVAVTFFMSIYLLQFIVSSNSTNWLGGIIVFAYYAVIAVTAWFYPIFPISE